MYGYALKNSQFNYCSLTWMLVRQEFWLDIHDRTLGAVHKIIIKIRLNYWKTNIYPQTSQLNNISWISKFTESWIYVELFLPKLYYLQFNTRNSTKYSSGHGINYLKFREIKLWNSLQKELKKSNSTTAFKHYAEEEIRMPGNRIICCIWPCYICSWFCGCL